MEHRISPGKRDRSNENLTRTIELLIRRCNNISMRYNLDIYLLVRRRNRYYEYNSNRDPSFPAPNEEIVSNLTRYLALSLSF
jgi:hypothetical protein